MKAHRLPFLLFVLLTTACAAPGAPEPAAASAATAAAPPASAAEPAAAPARAPEAAAPFDAAAVVAAGDRSEADRKLDAGRHPAETLAFFGVQPGMRVGEIASGTGYTAELLARAVGAQGAVYGVNSPWLLERFAEKPWSARLAKPVMQNTVRVDREFDAPFPEDVRDLDLVVNVLFYHDTVWMKTDRAAMNAAIFAALRPGGSYVVIDHSARDGAGVSEAQSLHRIEASLVRSEIEAAGFRFVAAGTFLHNAEDTRDWNASPMSAGERRGQSDRFALKFEKPQ